MRKLKLRTLVLPRTGLPTPAQTAVVREPPPRLRSRSLACNLDFVCNTLRLRLRDYATPLTLPPKVLPREASLSRLIGVRSRSVRTAHRQPTRIRDDADPHTLQPCDGDPTNKLQAS